MQKPFQRNKIFHLTMKSIDLPGIIEKEIYFNDMGNAYLKFGGLRKSIKDVNWNLVANEREYYCTAETPQYGLVRIEIKTITVY